MLLKVYIGAPVCWKLPYPKRLWVSIEGSISMVLAKYSLFETLHPLGLHLKMHKD